MGKAQQLKKYMSPICLMNWLPNRIAARAKVLTGESANITIITTDCLTNLFILSIISCYLLSLFDYKHGKCYKINE